MRPAPPLEGTVDVTMTTMVMACNRCLGDAMTPHIGGVLCDNLPSEHDRHICIRDQ